MDAFSFFRKVKSAGGEILAVYKLCIRNVDSAFTCNVIIVFFLHPHVLWVVCMTELHKPVPFFIAEYSLGAASTAITTVVEQ